MKKIFFLIVMLLSAAAFAQSPNWTGVKETNINVGAAWSVDIFTNQDGNHIIVQESSKLKYYKMNINGSAGSPLTIESSAVVSPSISGDANNIYIVYRKSSESSIIVKHSTDGGSNWSNLSTFSNSNASSIESVVSNSNLHITYQVSNQILYRYYNNTSGWSSEFEVSTNENGTNPRITALYGGTNNDNVYFLYQKENEDVGKWRRYEVTGNSWSTLYTGIGLPGLLSLAGLRVMNDRIIIYYNYFLNNYWYFRWISKDFNNNPLGSGSTFGNYNSKIYSTNTADNNSHTVYEIFNVSGPENGDLWQIDRSKSTSGGSSDIVIGLGEEDDPEINHLNLSSAGNDVHVIWKDIFGSNNGNNLRYLYDDQAPLAPTGLTLSQGINNHPLLQWTKNNEPDITVYKV
jgi:hypothetical protein